MAENHNQPYNLSLQGQKLGCPYAETTVVHGASAHWAQVFIERIVQYTSLQQNALVFAHLLGTDGNESFPHLSLIVKHKPIYKHPGDQILLKQGSAMSCFKQ